MRSVAFSADAQAELRDLLRRSSIRFGRPARDRYRKLVQEAAGMPAIDPQRVGVLEAPRDLYSFHLRHARTANAVTRPRHLLLFRYDDRQVRILRILYDGMDLPTHLRG